MCASTVLSTKNRRQRQEALVQGIILIARQLASSKLTSSQDMHYAEFAADEVRLLSHREGYGPLSIDKSVQEAALLAAIKEYEANKWKEIGKKVGKPAKVRPCSSNSLLCETSGVDHALPHRHASNMRKNILVARCDTCPRSACTPVAHETCIFPFGAFRIDVEIPQLFCSGSAAHLSPVTCTLVSTGSIR